MFTAVLFIIVKKWRQPKCPPPDEEINKNVAYQHNEILFGNKTNKQKNEELMHAATCMNLENIMLNEKASHERTHIV